MIGRLVSAGVAALVARGTYDALRNGAASEHLARLNHRGEPVTLAEGPAVAVGSLAGLVIAPRTPMAVKSSALLGVGGAAALGALDDLTGVTDVKGLRGHLGALRSGEITTGTIKLFGLAATGLVAGAIARRGRGGVVDAVLAGGVVAGAANLTNLLDLRPGRATKAFIGVSAPPLVAGSSPFGSTLAAPMGAAVSLLGEDLGERAMLGDAGANALGAAWGVGAASALSRGGLAATLALIVGATIVSERVSFSDVIERTPPLRLIDGLGRRPHE